MKQAIEKYSLYAAYGFGALSLAALLLSTFSTAILLAVGAGVAYLLNRVVAQGKIDVE